MQLHSHKKEKKKKLKQTSQNFTFDGGRPQPGEELAAGDKQPAGGAEAGSSSGHVVYVGGLPYSYQEGGDFIAN